MFNSKTTFIPFPEEEYNQLKEDIKFLRSALSQAKGNSSTDKEWLPRQEFMERYSIKSTQFNIWRTQGKLKTKRLGKKVYVHHSCVDAYFNGEYSKIQTF